MEIKNKKEKKKIGIIICFLLMGMLTGCGNTNTKIQEAMQAIQNLDYQGALTLLAEAEELGENERLIARGKGISYMGLTDYAQAIECFNQALSTSNGWIQPIDYDLNYYLAAAYCKNGQYQEAEETYNAILALKSSEKDAYFLRGCVRLQLSNFEGGKADFDKVISLDSSDYNRLIDIYQVLDSYGYTEEGQEYLQNALKKEAKMDVYDCGRIYYYLGEYEKAYIALDEAKSKGGAEAYLYLGKAYEATGDYNYAANVYNSYLSTDNQNAEIYNQLGVCEMEKKEYQKALQAFQAGLQIENNEIQQALSFNEIVAYEHLGDYQKAKVLLDAYLTNYPDDKKALREKEFLSTR